MRKKKKKKKKKGRKKKVVASYHGLKGHAQEEGAKAGERQGARVQAEGRHGAASAAGGVARFDHQLVEAAVSVRTWIPSAVP